MNYVFISGSTGGLGKAFAVQQANNGENLILTGRSENKLKELKNNLLNLNNKIDIKIYPCNLISESERLDLFKSIEEDGLSIKRLINVAGADTQMAFEKYTQDKLIFQSRVNFEAAISLTHFALKHKSNKLEILTISSMCGITPMPYFALYAASKAGLINFFDALRCEYKKNEVTITTVMPGSIPTRDDIIEDIKMQGLTGKLSKKSPDYVVEKSLKALKKGKKHCIPGLYNKIVYFFSKITPYCITAKIIKRKFSVKEKDAF